MCSGYFLELAKTAKTLYFCVKLFLRKGEEGRKKRGGTYRHTDNMLLKFC